MYIMFYILFLVNDTDYGEKFTAVLDGIKPCFDDFCNSLFGQGNNSQGNYRKTHGYLIQLLLNSNFFCILRI